MLQLKQVLGTPLDLTASQLALNEGIPPILEVQDDVCLEAIPVSIVGYVTTQIISVCSEIPYTHLLK